MQPYQGGAHLQGQQYAGQQAQAQQQYAGQAQYNQEQQYVQQQQQPHAQQQAPYGQQYTHQHPAGQFPPQGAQGHQDPNTQQFPQMPNIPQPSPIAGVPASPTVPDPSLQNPEACDANGLRWTWSSYPNTERPKSARSVPAGHLAAPPMVLPLSCMYSPMHAGGAPEVIGAPVVCRNCGAVWSRHGRLDVTSGYWACLSCFSRNPLPPAFDPNHPALQSDTVDYVLGTDSEARPSFIFVIDTCVPQEELDALKRNLIRSVEWLPPFSLVGFITFGHGITLWELGCEDLNKCYCLRGTRQYSATELTAMLNITQDSPALGRFLCPLDECEFALTAIIEELSVDPFPVAVGFRPQRATGTAIDVAVRLLEFLQSPSTCGKVMVFAGGPCTRGPGMVVGSEKSELLRFHRDFMDGNTPHYQGAYNFYNDMAVRLQAVHCALDVFAESFDQIGITELRRCVNQTGGLFVCGDTFDHSMFTESFQRCLQRCDINRPSGQRNSFALQILVRTGNETLISGCVGPCAAVPLSKEPTVVAQAKVSPNVIGAGGTNTWLISCADETLTLAFVFDTEVNDGPDKPGSPSTPAAGSSGQRFFQFQTTYVTANGQRRMRISSVVQPIAPTRESPYFVFHRTFDQACAAAVTSRLAVWLMEQQDNRWESTRRWLDRLLVQFVRRFGTFTANQPDSLRLASCLSLFPSFIFNLRRSEYFMVQNISPDETTFKRHWIMRETCDNCVLMIQPTLFRYTIESAQACPVPLDSTSLVQDHILLMDAFFNVHILWGSAVFQWMNLKYHENPDFAHFKAQVDAPDADAAAILAKRFPYPRFSKTDVNGSESRHVKTRMNPASVSSTSQSGDEVIHTDDASVSRFMQTLKAAAVSSSGDQ